MGIKLDVAVDDYMAAAAQLRDNALQGTRASVVFDEPALRHMAATRRRVEEASNHPDSAGNVVD